jgi:hypothetical protein
VLVSITNPAHIAEIEHCFDLAFDDGTRVVASAA